ncbi:translation initiation factor IF-2-like [Mustela putorius furo]|uniref:Translation initiation factor IF-2-like n=1 Tax=Mustela putorius furo TaxID=9669 RepID=A0A8U0SE29_MUSPF|nr:translation initiation factor IF-2-like [Mustela putorius furo]
MVSGARSTTASTWQPPEVAPRRDRKSLPFLPEGRRALRSSSSPLPPPPPLPAAGPSRRRPASPGTRPPPAARRRPASAPALPRSPRSVCGRARAGGGPRPPRGAGCRRPLHAAGRCLPPGRPRRGAAGASVYGPGAGVLLRPPTPRSPPDAPRRRPSVKDAGRAAGDREQRRCSWRVPGPSRSASADAGEAGLRRPAACGGGVCPVDALLSRRARPERARASGRGAPGGGPGALQPCGV